MSRVVTGPGITEAPLNADVRYRRWLAVPAFWVAWLATTIVLHIDHTANPPWKIWPWMLIAAALVAGAVMQLVRPFTAVRISPHGIRLAVHRRAWSEIERLETRGSGARSTLLLYRWRRSDPVELRQRWADGSLKALACQAEASYGVELRHEERSETAWQRVIGIVRVIIVILLTLVALALTVFLAVPGVWAARPTDAEDAYTRLRGAVPARGHGEVLILRVERSPASVADVLFSWDGTTKLSWYNPLRPPKVSADPVDEASSRSAAIAAGLRCAGRPLEVIQTGVEVGDIRGDAGGRVHRHDRIVSIDGQIIDAKEDVYVALLGRGPGQTIPAVMESSTGTLRTENLEVARLRDGTLVLRGVDIVRRRITVTTQDSLPSFEEDHSTGDSAGLAMAVTIVDAVGMTPLVPPGFRVAMTGSISPTGVVGPIGGLPQKIAAARRARAPLLLVPASQADYARGMAGDSLRVVGVSTLGEALQALGHQGAGSAACSNTAGAG